MRERNETNASETREKGMRRNPLYARVFSRFRLLVVDVLIVVAVWPRLVNWKNKFPHVKKFIFFSYFKALSLDNFPTYKKKRSRSMERAESV